MDQEKIGQFIKQIREENHLTQKEFADQLNVTFQAVSKWERGKNIPDIAVLKEISEKFHVNVDELLEGKRNLQKKNKNIWLWIVLFLLFSVGVFFIVKNVSKGDYEFKIISSKCADFHISGSAAYNKEKATIYISNIEFCGEEDLMKYRTISCVLYENEKDTKTKISTCPEGKNQTLTEFLRGVNIQVDHYSTQCKKMTSNTLTLEIHALTDENKTITYTIPLQLNDQCK